jgi:hypothetical protein
MAVTVLNTFADVQNFIDQVLNANGQTGGLGASPHGAFWRTMKYDDFVTGNVPGVKDDAGNPMPVLVKGSSATSNLILALQGTAGIFGPQGTIGQMPANGPPWFTPDQITSIANWIDAGCHQF